MDGFWKWFSSHWSSIWPVLVFFLGSLSTMGIESLKDRRQMKRDERTAQRDRERRVIERRETFELDHLLQLNAALHDLARAAMRTHLADLKVAKVSGKYASHQIDEEISNAFGDANRKVAELEGLVLDDSVRALVENAHDLINRPSGMRDSDVEAAKAAMAQGELAVWTAQKAIAARVRSIYQQADHHVGALE